MRTTDSVNGAKGLEQSGRQAAIMLAAQKCYVWDSRGNGEGGVSPTLTGDHNGRVSDYSAVVCAGNGQLNQISMAEQSNTLECMHDQQMILAKTDEPQRKYIVRRLTPLECCRLQGYPDGWTENIKFEKLSQEQVDQLEQIRKTWAEVNGKNYKPCKDRSALEKWFNGLQNDSAEYKAYGNSLAIPCSYDVIRRVANAIKEAKTE